MNNQSLDPLLQKIVEYLKTQYDCHTIILYGSRARGDATIASDYDMLAIRDEGQMEREGRQFEGAFLDGFIYSIDEIQNPSDFLRIKDGLVLCQKATIGDDLINQVKVIFNQGPAPKPDWEKQVITTWGQKMLQRAHIGDIEGNFRAHWLLYDLLESYFHLRDKWYLGPKEAFQWLKTHDIATYSLFEKALNQGIHFEHLKALTESVNSIPHKTQQMMAKTLSIQMIAPTLAETYCRELSANLPEWFGIPEANERYAKGCIERTTFAAELDGHIKGIIVLEFPFPHNANIYWMAVSRENQGKNIGMQLFGAAEQYCEEHGYQSMTVETLSPKQQDTYYLKTYHFYEKCGFKPLFELNPYGPDHLMCYMHKSI
ncbi:GNAT family N-acetyltransferase [Candidatus Berkiella aquae]|uniref:Acetyltransferase (GNAT) family protein n=1 Tax=Candidatus Berkiella aquae TaxID=295108 RepID=A0A0Q9Z2S9_9GAMM|nr:GNAT family N-acetyltransferase [Candidatus Berkiella aquae]MCS5711884.1 GNAT family N-acetyltransferase [Candidatus Berkiella aquae]